MCCRRTNVKSLALKNTYKYLKTTYFFRYMGDAFFYIFLYVFLGSMNFSNDKIGFISALTPLAGLLGSILFSRISKNINTNRILMIIFNAIETVVALLFALFPQQNFIFYLVIITFTSLFNGPFYALLDGYSATYILKRGKQYSSMRVMGAISYVIGSLIGAILMGSGSVEYSYLFYASAFFFLASFILSLALPKPEELKEEEVVEKQGEPLKLKKYPELIIYAFFSFVLISLAMVSDNFFGIFLTGERALEKYLYGYMTSLTLFVELLVFIFIIKRKNMFKNQTFALLFIGISFLIRPLSVALNLPTTLILIFGLLRGLAWGYYVVYNVLFIGKNTPVKYLTPLLFIMQIAVTLGRIIASLIIGEALERFTYQNVFVAISSVMVLSLIILSVAAESVKKKKLKLNDQQGEGGSL